MPVLDTSYHVADVDKVDRVGVEGPGESAVIDLAVILLAQAGGGRIINGQGRGGFGLQFQVRRDPRGLNGRDICPDDLAVRVCVCKVDCPGACPGADVYHFLRRKLAMRG